MSLEQLNTYMLINDESRFIKTKISPYHTSQKLNCIIDLNIKCKTIKLLEDNMGENLDGTGCCNDF